MSRSIDERIVEMKFDNKQFEGGIKESLASLNKLEDALNKNISSKSIDEISEAASRVDVSGLTAGIDALNNKFSAFGIAGITVIQRITNELINGLGAAIGTVSDAIISGGLKRAQNIQTARFQLQGIVGDVKEVEAIMSDASNSVQDTAYSLDSAAKAASQFAATGLRSGEEMQKALRGISGVAATTSSDYEGVSRIFTTVAGNGRIMGDQLLQLSSRGLNAAATLKDFFNAVSADSSKASAEVANAIQQLTGASNTFKGSAEEYKDYLSSSYEAAVEAYNNEYKLRQKTLNDEYKDLQKTLNAEYNARKKAYDDEYNALKEALDNEYKAKQKELNNSYNELKKSLDKEYELKKETFDNEYQALQKSLDAEITAQQKANNERLKEGDKAYQEDVANFKKATEEKIALIDKEYGESLKLIDEEAYKKTKALEDQITAIDKAAEAEEKERKLAERNNKLKELQNAIDSATSAEAREKASKALLEYQEKVAQEELAEQRKNQKAKLKDQIAAIKEEASVKKQAAKDSRDAAVQSANDEANAVLEAKSEQRDKEREQVQEEMQAEIEAMREARNQKLTDLKKSQNEELTAIRESQSAQLEAFKESQNAELEALRNSHNNQLSSLKEAQNGELEALKEGQSAQLEALKESQSAQLEALKKTNNEKLKAIKETNEAALKSFSSFATGVGITESDIRDLVSKGMISFNMFAEAMDWAFGKHAHEANATFLGSLANVKAALARTGEAFFKPLIQDEGELVQFLNTIRIKVNAFNAVIGESGGLAETFTDWVRKVISKLNSLVDKIDVSNGSIKHFVDAVQFVFEKVTGFIDGIGSTIEKIVNSNMIDPFKILTDVIEILSGLFSGIWSVIKPVGDALKDVFLTANAAQGFYDLVDKVKDLAQNFKLTEEQSDKLNKAFKGVFEFIKSLFGVVGRLFGLIDDKGGSVGDVILEIIYRLGELLGNIAEWINTSKGLDAVINALSSAISFLLSVVTSDKLKIWNDFIDTLEKVTGINFSAITSAISKAASKIGEYIVDGFSNGININISDIIESAKQLALGFIDKVKELFGIKSPSKVMEEVAGYVGEGFIKGIMETLDSIKQSAIDFINSFMSGISDATSDLGNSKDKLSPIIDWIKNTFWPALTGNFGSLVSIAGSVGMIYVLIQLGKAFTTLAGAFGSIFGSAGNLMNSASSALNSVKDVAEAYEKDLKADAFKKTAIGVSVGLLAITASLFVLSKLDPVGVAVGSAALIAVAVVFAKVVDMLSTTLRKTKTVESALDKAADGFSKGFKKLGQAVKIKAIGAAVKDFAIAIGIIIIDIAGIMFLYHNYKTDFNAAITVVAEIAGAIMVAVATMSILGQFTSKGMAGFAKASIGVLALSAAVLVCIKALKDILSIDETDIDPEKLKLLQNVFIGVMALTAVIGLASRIAGSGGIKLGSLLGMCALIVTSIYAIKKIFDVTLPTDYEEKLTILCGLFAALGVLFIAIGAANRLAGGNMKATGEILAMCAFIAVVTAALVVLELFPAEKLIPAAKSLGIVLCALAFSLAAASALIDSNAGPTILAMAVMVGVIVAALSFLSFIEWDKLWPGAVSLGIVLFTLALVFAAVNKMANKDMLVTALSIVAILGTIIGGLKVLSSVESWETLVAAAGAIGGILLSIAGAFKIINSTDEIKDDKMMAFILGVLGTAVIAMMLKTLSDIPWEQLIASALAVSSVLLAIGGAFRIINTTEEIGLDKMMALISGCLVAMVVGLVLKLCNSLDWQSMLATAASIAGVLIAMGVAFAIMNNTKFDLDMAGGVVAGCLAIMAIGLALAKAASQDWKSLLAAGVSISVVLLALSIAMVICSIAGGTAEAAITGILLLDAFIADLALVLYALGELADAEVLKDGADKLKMIGQALGDFVGSIIEGIGEGIGKALEAIGTSLSNFMANAQGFFDGLDQMDESKVQAAAALAGVVLALSAAEFIDGITNLLGVFTGTKDVTTFSQKLVTFGEAMKKFDDATVGVNANRVKTAAEAALTLIKMANEVPNEGGWLGKIVGENDLGKFGLKLATFGPSLAVFDSSIASLRNTSKYKDIADATLTLIKMADAIPNSGGWLGKVLGDNDIGTFGLQLSLFGPSITAFDKSIAGISNTDKWKDIAKGTLSLIRMANAIPNEGGWLAKVIGDNDIGEFGHSLSKYGYWIQSFDTYTKNITEERLNALAKCTFILINMYKKMVELIDTKNFELPREFGKAINNYAYWLHSFYIYTQDVEENRLIELARSTVVLINMVKKMTDSLSKDDLSMPWNFGQAINNYAYWLKSFNTYTQGIEESRVNEIVRATMSLITLCISMRAVDAGVVSNFGKAMGNFAKNGLSSFIKAFATYTPLAVAAITTSMLLLNTTAALHEKLMESTFNDLSNKSMSKYIDGIVKNTPLAVTAVNLTLTTLRMLAKTDLLMPYEFNSLATRSMSAYCKGIVSATPSAYAAVTVALELLTARIMSDLEMQTAFYNLASRSVELYVKGISDNTSSAVNAVENMVSKVIEEFKDHKEDFKDAGQYLAEGLRDGIDNKISDVADKAREMARAAREAVENEFQEQSPSKVMRRDGEYFGEGLALGIISKIKRVKQAAIEMAKTPVGIVETALDEIPELDPTITPIVDLTNVMDAADTINGLFNDALSNIGVNVTKASTSMATKQKSNNQQNIQNDSGSGETKVSFVQNNYSPKALSRIDIYRDTRNQLAQFREAVART